MGSYPNQPFNPTFRKDRSNGLFFTTRRPYSAPLPGCSKYQVCGAYPSYNPGSQTPGNHPPQHHSTPEESHPTHLINPSAPTCVICGSLFVSLRVHSWFFVYLSPCPEVSMPICFACSEVFACPELLCTQGVSVPGGHTPRRGECA